MCCSCGSTLPSPCMANFRLQPYWICFLYKEDRKRGERDRQTDRQTDRDRGERERETDRQTETQTERERERERERDRALAGHIWLEYMPEGWWIHEDWLPWWASGQISASKVADLRLNLAFPVGLSPGWVTPVAQKSVLLWLPARHLALQGLRLLGQVSSY